jgi:hypothetical protein
MHWMMYLDGRPVDLGAFGDIVTGGTGSGATQHHVWAVALAKPRGTHTLRTILTLDTEMNDGEHRYAAGTYDMTTRFTLVFRCRDPHTTSCWRDW